MEKIRVSSVSYLNSKPFVYGLSNPDFKDRIELSVNMPSDVASRLESGQADIGLVPVAALLDNEKLEVVSDKCIGTNGKVRTVVLAGEVPLDDIETILMDYQSRTSVLLAKVLSKHYWKKTFRWEDTCSGFEKNRIKGKKAGVVIGDRVFAIEEKYACIYDLSTEWLKFTGLPFVFAVWAANKPLKESFKNQFNQALGSELNHMEKIATLEKAVYPDIDIFTYLTDNIQFELNEEMQKGMRLFLDMAKKVNTSD
jgi:chorismate dehydratase